MRGHNNMYLRHGEEDLRDSMRRKSLGPADLRLTHWKKDQDLRVQMRPRLGSGPPDLSSLRYQKSEKSINERFSELTHVVEGREDLIRRLKTGMSRLKAGMSGQTTQSEEEHDNNVTSDSHDTNEDGEVTPSEDELTGVQYSESEKEPTQGPSRTSYKPITKAKIFISPIKYPVASPKKNEEDLPLSKLETPRRQKVDAKKDLRRKLEMVPVFSEPKLDSGDLESRLGRDLIRYQPDTRPNRDSPHSTHPFIARNITWQDRATGNSDEEEDEDDAGRKGVADPNNPRRK